MVPNFNTDRPKVSDEEINRHKNFDLLVKQFKERSLKQAQGDESWWKHKKVRYSTIIAGVTVVCSITYFAVFKNNPKQSQKDETLITSNTGKPIKKVNRPLVDAPSQKLKIPYSAYKINNAKGGEIIHPTKSKIKIPKSSFVDKQGKDIVGDITIEYREFHDLGDIVASGIPMRYDSAGTHYNLESAGMFDIKGSRDGEPVFIKPDKTIEIELVSNNDEKRFNQYFLDTLERNWKYLKKDKVAERHPKKDEGNNEFDNDPQPNLNSPKLTVLKEQIDVVIPKKIDSVKTVYVKKAQQLPKTKEPTKPVRATEGRPSFKLDGSYDEFPELAAFNNVVFEVGPENPNYAKDFHEITWSDLKITQGPVKGKNYILTLSYRNRTEKLIVYPVLTADNFSKAQNIYEEKFSEYEALIEKHKQAEQKLMAEMQAKQAAYMTDLKKKQEAYDLEKAKLFAKYNTDEQNELSNAFNKLSNSVRATRLFRVSQFGVFNSDCPHMVPVNKSVSPVFVSENKETFTTADYIYLVDHKTRSVYVLNAQDGFRLNYNAESPYSVCIFKQNKMYLCNKNDFQQTVGKGDNKFPVKMLAAGEENLIDFKKALEI